LLQTREDKTVCIGVPGKIVELETDWAVVDLGGLKRKVGTQLAEGLALGDYVLIHAGYVIQKIDEKEAHETLALLSEMYDGWEEESK
jgi:hydrogenase expression/formation protein HypC